MNSSQRKKKREKIKQSAYVHDKIFKEYDNGKCIRCGCRYFAFKKLCMDCRDQIAVIWLEVHEKILRTRYYIEYNKRE